MLTGPFDTEPSAMDFGHDRNRLKWQTLPIMVLVAN